VAASRTAPIYVLRVLPEGAQKPTAIDVSDRVTSLTSEDGEVVDKLALEVSNFTYENFEQPTFVTGGILEFSYGYSDGNMSPPRQAVITKVTGGAKLKIEATGKAAMMNTVPRVRGFRLMKRSDVVRQIADENGYASEAQFIQDTEIVLDQITQARLTDAQLLRNLAQREGYEFFIDYRGLHFHPRDTAQAPRRKFTYYTDPGQGDILAPPEVKNDITAKAGVVAAKGIDPLTHQPIDVRADNDSTAGRPGLGTTLALESSNDPSSAVSAAPVGASTRIVAVDAQNGVKTERRVAQDAVIPTTEKTQAAAERQAKGIFQKLQFSAVQLAFSAVGDPLMEAKTVIEIDGLGRNLSGRYYVTKVVHKLGADYRMDIECRRDNRALPTGKPTQSKADVNKKNAPETGDASSTEMTATKVVNPQTGQTETKYVPKGSVAK